MIAQRVLTFIRDPRRRDFASLALAVFDYQFRHNLAYSEFCRLRGRTPATVGGWREIPTIPAVAFKELDLGCAPAQTTFLTSGTSRGVGRRGRHPVPRLDVYRESALTHFAACVLPDGARLRMLALTPPPRFLPESSLAQMVDWVMEAYGTDKGRYFIDPRGVDLEGFSAELARAEREGRPVCILALTRALTIFFEACEARGRRFTLPAASRVMDTGGDKGRGAVMARGDFLAACRRWLGVPEAFCVSEYGMTELCSQFYDNALCNTVAKKSGGRFKVGPAWTRTVVVDPETLAETAPGVSGILCHFDLANCGSVMAVQTDDLGYAVEDGFEIVGRAPEAEVRGCALALEDLLSPR